MARLLLFDIDMTLIREVGAGPDAGTAAIDCAFERVFHVAGVSQGVSFDGRTNHDIFTGLIADNGLSNGDDAAALDAITAAYLAALAETTAAIDSVVLPGVHDLLAALRGTHGAVGLATGNLRRGAELKLATHGLWDAFAAGGFGDHTDNRAELVSDGLANLAAHTGIEPHAADCIVIGDTPLDIAAAHAIGARALGVATGRYGVPELLSHGADWAVEDLGRTADVLAMLGQ